MIKDLTLYLIRHGQSLQNAKPDLIGQDWNEPLSQRGKTQAKSLGKYLGYEGNSEFDHIYCSNYTRAYETAKIACELFTTQKPSVVAELQEYSAGDMTGRNRSVVMTPEVTNSMSTLGMLFKFPNGESLYEVQQRAVGWMEKNLLNNPAMDGKRLALFSHGMTIKCILQYIMQFNQHMTWRIAIDNTSISKVRIKDGLWHVDSINDTSHLEVE